MKIKEIIEVLENNKLIVNKQGYIDENIEILDITYNSKECKNGSLFFVKGVNFKEEYIEDAKNNGASLMISEKEYEKEYMPNIIVSDVRIAMLKLASHFFGYAYKDLNMIGITGTKGKTTTTYYLKNILDEHMKKQIGLISTIGVYTGTRDEEAHLTTPEAVELQRYIKEVKENDLEFLVMEVSSQGYKVNRMNDISFEIGAFLNISEDHISPAEHPNFNDYLDCKLQFVKNCKNVVVNYNTDYFEVVKEAAKNAEKIITYGTEKDKDHVDYYYDNVVQKDGVYEFTVHSEGYERRFKTKMFGRFNIENAMVAIILAKYYNVADEDIEKGILKTSVKGRMNVYEKDGVMAIVDYAHNKLSFQKFFEAVRTDFPDRRIITVAGGPGGKAFARRKDLGEIASKYSSYMYLTAEDPQFEKVEDICREIATYVICDYEIVEDRKEAIEKAVANAKKGDILAILAKGEETYQKVEGKFTPYESDLAIIERLMKG